MHGKDILKFLTRMKLFHLNYIKHIFGYFN